jgi:hypothetical protein
MRTASLALLTVVALAGVARAQTGDPEPDARSTRRSARPTRSSSTRCATCAR